MGLQVPGCGEGVHRATTLLNRIKEAICLCKEAALRKGRRGSLAPLPMLRMPLGMLFIRSDGKGVEEDRMTDS